MPCSCADELQQRVELGAFARRSARPPARRGRAAPDRCTWRARSPAAAARRRRARRPGRRRASMQAGAVEPVARLVDRGALGRAVGLAARAGRRSVKPDAGISALCCATTRFSSTVMPGNSRMFWKVRATRASLAMRKFEQPLQQERAAVADAARRIRPARRLVEAGDAVEDRRLSGAVRPDQS